MAGTCLMDRTGLTEFQGLDSIDLLARLIFSEAEAESLDGKRGVAHVAKNRKAKNNVAIFGGDTYAEVILKPGEFDGMNQMGARCPTTSSQAWRDSLSIASNMATTPNPIGNCLWFNPPYIYHARTLAMNGWIDGYSFDNGATYVEVVEKKVIGNHTFFRVRGF